MRLNPKILTAGAVVLLLLAIYIFTPVKAYLSPANIQSFIGQFGPWAPMVFIVAYILLTIAFFPTSVMSVLGGVLFGAIFGTIYVVIAATIAATIAFSIAHFFGRDTVEKLAKGKVKEIEDKIEHHGFTSIALMRLMFLPYMPLSYVAGLTKIRWRDFTLATFLTNIPGGFVFVYLGGSLDNPKNIALAIILILLVFLIPQVIKRLKK